MASLTSIFEGLLQPSLLTLFLAIVFIIGAPLALHFALASSNTYTTPPSVLLLGPSSVGKTSLLTLYEHGAGDNAPPAPSSTAPLAPAATHTSQKSHAVELLASTDSDSKTSFRNRDDASGTHTKFLLVDTPGHGKLREVGWGKLRRLEKLKAVVFVVDAAALGEQDVLASTASYLYDVLLHLQKLAGSSSKSSSKSANNNKPVPVLIAANKMDLFTALPATLVKMNLEAELTRIRQSKSKGLLDSGVGIDDVGSEEQDSWLGEYGSDKFHFKQMQEFDIDVEVLPGNVTGDGPGVDKWWWWIAQQVSS
jgi:signal recognition particle receptor subunit beta